MYLPKKDLEILPGLQICKKKSDCYCMFLSFNKYCAAELLSKQEKDSVL